MINDHALAGSIIPPCHETLMVDPLVVVVRPVNVSVWLACIVAQDLTQGWQLDETLLGELVRGICHDLVLRGKLRSFVRLFVRGVFWKVF